MTAKEKSDELYWKFYNQIEHHLLPGISHKMSVLCAITAVNEIINDLKQYETIAIELHPHAQGLIFGSLFFWVEVRNELNKMT